MFVIHLSSQHEETQIYQGAGGEEAANLILGLWKKVAEIFIRQNQA